MAISVQCAVVAHRRATTPGDFDLVREFGRRFIAGKHLYENGTEYPYTPLTALYGAAFALINPNLGFAVRGYALA